MEGGVGGERGEIYANVARFARNGKRVSWATLGSGAEDGFAALWPSPSPPLSSPNSSLATPPSTPTTDKQDDKNLSNLIGRGS